MKAVVLPDITIKTIDMHMRAGRGLECTQYVIVGTTTGFGMEGGGAYEEAGEH